MTTENSVTTRSRSKISLPKSAFNSPRPTPQFFPGGHTFSTKKDRGTPANSLPPRPPIKSAPAVSRIFPHVERRNRRAQVVSFTGTTDQSYLDESYDTSSKQTYFQQCFVIIQLLGSGSFGEVFKVKSKKDGKFYAVKRSHDKFRNEYDRKRKVEEVAKYESLPPHTNCVHFYHAWEERQKLFIQIELCPMSLNQFAELNHEISETIIWRYLVDLLMAVKHLHDHNLIHMDIKAENIFISSNGICKLGDFGLVIDLTKKVDLKEAQEGDPKYLSPELLQGKFGKPADIFSLGMTILELASDLDLPRGGEGWHQLREGHIPEEFLQGRSFDMKYVIRQMLHPCPDTRPTAVQLLAFPCIRKVWKQRCRDYMITNTVATVKYYFRFVLHFFTYIYWLLSYPYSRLHKRFVKRVSHTKPSYASTISSSAHPSTSVSSPYLDTSISDDECFEEDIVASNSACAPLDSSSDNDSFCKPKPRRAYTTPPVRIQRPARFPSPFSSSPLNVQPAKKDWHGSTSESLESSFEDDRSENSFSPNVSYHGDDEVIKCNIEPKNLFEVFQSLTDDDD